MASTLTVQKVGDQFRVYPELIPLLGVPGLTREPAITIANDVMQKMLAQNMDWKWNRAYVPTFLTVALQQDYVTSVTDLGWLEQGWRIDINNSTNNGNLAPKPIFTMEAVRDLIQTSSPNNPFNLSFIPNSLAFLGTWTANTAIGCGYGVAQTPISPIQQFMDVNGNILYINSNSLGLGINSPGFTGTPITLPPGNPYGITGGVKPSAPPNSAAGTLVTDNTVTWTVADPNGYAIRLVPLPAQSGLTWLVAPVYQKKPPIISSLTQTIAPIPDEYGYLFRQGFLAMLYDHAGSKKAQDAYMKWEEALFIALKGADREREQAVMYPGESIMGDSGWTKTGLPIGPAWPFSSFPY